MFVVKRKGERSFKESSPFLFSGGKMTRQKLFQGLCSLSILFAISAGSTAAVAGECKVKEPTQAVIADALKIGTLLDVQMTKLAAEHRKKTGKELKVALVARAGQDMKDILTLRDTDRRGRRLSLQEIVTASEYEVPFEESGGRDPIKVKQEISKSFGDRKRQSVYSHYGLIFWNHPEGFDPGAGQRIWYFRHMLRPCISDSEIKNGIDPNKPELYDEDIFRFFTDDPHELRAQIIIPTIEIQENLEKLVLPKMRMENGVEVPDNGIPKSFNGKFYNAAAHWRNTTEANSNQWVSELVAAATQPFGRVRSRAEAQEILASTDYRPTRALLSGQQAMAALPFASKIAPYVRLNHDEQPYYSQYAIADLITTLSIEEWMKRNNWVVIEQMVHVSGKTKIPEKKQQRDRNSH